MACFNVARKEQKGKADYDREEGKLKPGQWHSTHHSKELGKRKRFKGVRHASKILQKVLQRKYDCKN